MNWIFGIILLLLLANGLSANNSDTNISNNSGYVRKDNVKVCIGTQSKLSVPSNKEQHIKNIRERYNNCTYIDGNLELTWIQDPNADLSFLENIQEVTGYVLINHIEVKNVRLPKLQIIRGTKLFKSNDRNYALMVAYTKSYTLELPSLREILQGSAGFYQNIHLCGVQSIDWGEILFDPQNFTHEYDFDIPRRTCECHKSCERGCWGPGEHNCQKFSKTNCSPQCAGGRCFGPRPRDCCHLFCAGGCVGPTQKDCIACKNFYDDGVCKEECPPMQKYNPINYNWEQNPEGRYAYGATCVKSCPEHLLRDNGACVRSCPSNKMAKSGECILCNGPCPKTCREVPVLNSANIDKFKNCTVIEGSIRILEHAFTGYSDIFQNFSMGQRYIPMHPDRLEVFANVKEITGFLDVQAKHEHFKNLSYFRNLEVIHGRVLNDNYFAAFSIVSSSLSSLGLHSLKRINAGTVVIQNNENLCFVKNIAWGSIIKVKDPKVVIPDNNKNSLACRADNETCSPECDRQGCWGKGPDQCLNCLNMKYNGNCISDCKIIPNTYKFDNKTCKTCHPECIGCIGAGDLLCQACVHVRDDGRCVKTCQENKYNDNGVCRPCHETCEGCTGPNNNIGLGGCNTCTLAIIYTNGTVDRCLPRNATCPDGYFWEYVNPQEQSEDLKALSGKAICRKCHPRCEICTNYGFHTEVCSKCSGYKRGEQCEDECPSDHYADNDKRECFECHPECKNCTGPSSSDCFSCRNFKIFGDQDPFGNNTTFNCTSKCPPEYPYHNFHDSKIGPHCSKAPPKGAKLAGADPSLIGYIAVGICLILIVGIIAWAYNCRQRNLANKHAAKMSLVLTGYEDSEPLRPTNAGANLAKLRIIKECELRKGGTLGMGAFGKVYKGVWVPESENIKEKIPVAIKELLEVNGTESSKEFLDEAYIMASVDHPNLLKLLAICMTSQMMLITQLMPLGCLLDYVRIYKDKIGSKALLNWSTQIAKGMSYLEDRGIVHRDLAARNVLVQTPSCVKITDFGLAKLLNHDSHKYIAAGGKMPIKWLAIECIRKREFTSKSDVWAFAVTIWEILTFGQKPYENIAAKELPDLIEQGLKLYQPECCSLDIYMKLVSCWHLDSNLRPTFKELVNIFADFARDPGGFLHIPGDKFTRLPAYTTQDEKNLIRNLAASTSRAADISATEDYLQPKPDNVGINEDISEDQPHLNRYCKDPINKTSSGEGDETDSNLREIGVGNLRLDLPVDEDDYLMPTCQKNKGSTSSVNNLNNNNNLSTNANANAGYMDLIAGAPSIDNPEYLLNANSTGSNTARILQGASITSNPDNELVQTPPIPTQTLGIPVIKAAGSNPAGLDVEQQNSDHEYYNDLQRELQPLRKNGNETRV